MEKKVNILIADDCKEDFELITTNLLRAGIRNDMLNFVDGQEILDFFFNTDKEGQEDGPDEYVVFLNVYLPKVDGIKVLTRIKQDDRLKKIPVIIFSTTDDQQTIDQCHDLGFQTKPLPFQVPVIL